MFFTAPIASTVYPTNGIIVAQFTTTLPIGSIAYIGVYQATPILRYSLVSARPFSVIGGSNTQSFTLSSGSIWPLQVAVGYNCRIAGLLCTWEYSKTIYAPQPVTYAVNYNQATQSASSELVVWDANCTTCGSPGSTFCKLCADGYVIASKFACTDCWARADGTLTNLRMNLEWGEVIEIAADLNGVLSVKNVWRLTAELENQVAGNRTLIPETLISGWTTPVIKVMGVSLDIGFFFDLLGTYRAALSVAGEVNLAVSAEIQFKGILRYGSLYPNGQLDALAEVNSFSVDQADAALAGSLVGAIGILPELIFKVSDYVRLAAGPKIELELELNLAIPPYSALPAPWTPADFSIGSCQSAHYIQYKVDLVVGGFCTGRLASYVGSKHIDNLYRRTVVSGCFLQRSTVTYVTNIATDLVQNALPIPALELFQKIQKDVAFILAIDPESVAVQAVVDANTGRLSYQVHFTADTSAANASLLSTLANTPGSAFYSRPGTALLAGRVTSATASSPPVGPTLPPPTTLAPAPATTTLAASTSASTSQAAAAAVTTAVASAAASAASADTTISASTLAALTATSSSATAMSTESTAQATVLTTASASTSVSSTSAVITAEASTNALATTTAASSGGAALCRETLLLAVVSAALTLLFVV